MNTTNIVKFGSGDSFPAPFKGRSTKSTDTSKYTNTALVKSASRVSTSAINFLMKKYEIDKGIDNTYAIGTALNTFVVERTVYDELGNKGYTVAIYEDGGNLTAFTVSPNTYNIDLYDENEHSNIIILMVLWEQLYNDEEFFQFYNKFSSHMDNYYSSGNSDSLDVAWDALCVLADNIYRVLKNEHFVINDINSSINLTKLTTNIASNVYTPTSTLLGTFEFLKASEETIRKTFSINDLVGKYPISPSRVFTKEEQQMMVDNRLDETYIPDDIDFEVCEDIVKTTNMKNPFRTLTFVGPPGTGKSAKTKAVANGIVLPHIIFSCHPNTEIFDFVGQVLPPDMDNMDKEAWNLAAKVEELGGLNFRNLAKIYELPSSEDISICPEEVYLDITGSKTTPLGKKPTVDDAIKAWTQHMHIKFNEALRQMQVATKGQASFRYAKSEFLIGVEKGWTIEVQEPTTVVNQGVFVGLNSILNEGVYTLQTGETVYRHPDNVIIFTTNVDLEGLNDMNVSFLDRSQEVYSIQKPPIQDICDRVMSISGNTDRKLVMEICKVCDSIATMMDKEGITDGICGIRSAINWATKATYANPYRAALSTVIGKTSLREENQKRMLQKLDESYFFQFKNH